MVWRTTIITSSTCFLLGTTFTHWIADHNVLWRTPLTIEALEDSIRYYAIIGHGPSSLGWAYASVVAVTLIAAIGKLVSGWKGKGGEVLFDGAAVLLVATIAYNQASEVFPSLTSLPWPLPHPLSEHDMFPVLSTTVRDLANDNIITAVMLTGVMLLQAGRYYSSKSSQSAESGTVESSAPPSDSEFSDSSARPQKVSSPVSGRMQTPFRELTEAEAMELKQDSDTGEKISRRR